MNVVRQDVDALNAELKVALSPADYQGKVKASLEKYRKTAKIPGFRPGHVPLGLIQKQYGKSVLAEELNKLVNSALYDFISQNKIEILGNPIPKSEADVKGDFDNPDSFEFVYEIGLAPTFQISLDAKSKFDYLKVKIDDKLLDKQIEDLRRRYGKLVSADTVGDKDMVLVQLVELNDDQSIKDGGILHSSTISLEFVNDDKVKKEFIGKVKGDKLVVDPSKVSRGGKDTASMLGIKEEELDSVSDKFQLTINEIKHMEMADLNQDFYDRLFGPDAVNSEADLRQKIGADLENMFANDSDRLLTRSIYEDLVENTKLDLPSAFLKKWIKLSNEKPISDDQIEREFDAYLKGLKWQLIQASIFKNNEIKVDNNEVMDFTKGLLINNYAQYGMPAPEDKELTGTALQILQNKEEANRIYDMLAEQKLTHYFKSTVKLKDKEIPYDEFIEIASK